MKKHFLEACEGDCRWPLWQSQHNIGRVCGAPSLPGRSYCARHHALAYPPAPERKPTVKAEVVK